jgi:hypothetical protein
MEKESEPTISEQSSPTSKSSSKKRKSKKRQHAPFQQLSTAAPTITAASKKQKQNLPLKGITLSVTTLKDGANSLDDDKKTTNGNEDASGYNEVCQICKELGAQVTSQVSKRVQLVLCTRFAVEKATQRVRKAYKKKIPLVDISWLRKCQETGKLLDVEPFLLDDLAKEIITNREKNRTENDGDTGVDVPDNTGWTEPVSFGCSCVCHENGAEKDCQWCSQGCAA